MQGRITVKGIRFHAWHGLTKLEREIGVRYRVDVAMITDIAVAATTDRIADAIILVAAGYALSPAFGPGLGWLAALLAVGTAYVRQVGGALGCAQDFVGPLAKQQRMALLTAGVLSSAFEALAWGYEGRALAATLALISGGAAVTIARRLRRISTEIAR